MREKPCKNYSRYKGVYVPRCGCEPCWDKYFFNNVGEVAAAEFGLRKFGNRGVDSVRGEKYRKQLKRFVKQNGSPLEAYEETRNGNEEVRERVDVQPGQDASSVDQKE